MKRTVAVLLAVALAMVCYSAFASAKPSQDGIPIPIDNICNADNRFLWTVDLVQVFSPDFGSTVGGEDNDIKLTYQILVIAEWSDDLKCYVVTNINTLVNGTAEAEKQDTPIPQSGFAIALGGVRRDEFKDLLTLNSYIVLDSGINVNAATVMTVYTEGVPDVSDVPDYSAPSRAIPSKEEPSADTTGFLANIEITGVLGNQGKFSSNTDSIHVFIPSHGKTVDKNGKITLMWQNLIYCDWNNEAGCYVITDTDASSNDKSGAVIPENGLLISVGGSFKKMYADALSIGNYIVLNTNNRPLATAFGVYGKIPESINLPTDEKDNEIAFSEDESEFESALSSIDAGVSDTQISPVISDDASGNTSEEDEDGNGILWIVIIAIIILGAAVGVYIWVKRGGDYNSIIRSIKYKFGKKR